MDIKRIYRIGLLFLFSMVLVAQKAPLTKAQLIENAIQEKLDVLYTSLIDKCNQDVLETSIALVDSILLKEAKTKTVDKFVKPKTIQKPEKPSIKLPKDTTGITPLFEN